LLTEVCEFRISGYQLPVGRRKVSGRCECEMHTEIERHNGDIDLKSFSEYRTGVLMESGSIGKFSLDDKST
jgi:hypothetical protein